MRHRHGRQALPTNFVVCLAHILVAALFCGLVWNYWKTWQPYHDPLDWSPDFSVKRIPSPPLRSNQRASFFTDSSPGLSCRGQMAWDPSRLSWYKAEFEQNTGALANGYPYPDEYAFSVTSPLNISQGATVLDVGCGSGYFVGLLWKHMDIRIAGIDPLPFFVQAAGNAFPDGSFCSASATNMSGVCVAGTRLLRLVTKFQLCRTALPTSSS